MMRIRSLIVDDEPLAREGIRELLKKEADIDVVGECGDGVQAIETIEAMNPDLVFLDVQMPEVDGFGVLEALDPASLPAIIFVTAYDDYALRAFDTHAVDYLLKPINPERFTVAVDRAKGRLASSAVAKINKNLLALLDSQSGVRPYRKQLIVRSVGRIQLIDTRDVDWISAEDDYVCLHLQGKKHLLRQTMSTLEQSLDPENFVRIHRSTIVNIDRITELKPLSHGEYDVVLKDQTRLTASRTYRPKLAVALREVL